MIVKISLLMIHANIATQISPIEAKLLFQIIHSNIRSFLSQKSATTVLTTQNVKHSKAFETYGGQNGLC